MRVARKRQPVRISRNCETRPNLAPDPAPFPSRHPEEIPLAAKRALKPPGDLVDAEPTGEALSRAATRTRPDPRGASRSDHRLPAGPGLRPGGPHTERQGVRTVDRTGPREWSARTGQFCRRD